jgi:hypothetical protein
LRQSFAALGGDGPALYERTVGAMRGVLADGLHEVFLVGLAVALVVVAVSLFLPEIPLRAHPVVRADEFLTHPGCAWGDVAWATEGRALQDVQLAGGTLADDGEALDLAFDRSNAGISVPGG